jgi:thiamine biosynthesis lipoprotein
MPPERVDAFRAMGVEVLVAGATPFELTAVRRLFASREGVFSRFLAGSELSRVNRTKAPALVVSEQFARTLERALDAARATGGLVDPTLGEAIEAAGYDRDFALLTPDDRPPEAASPGQWRGVRVSGRLVTRLPGIALDLNGIVKGQAVDDALALIAGDGLVSAGGDIAARGKVVVALPGGGSVALHAGGLATSGTGERHWLRAGERRHHLIDPRTGRPSASPWTHATVAAGSCLAADVAAKAAFLLGEDGPDWLDSRGLPGRFVRGGDAVVVNRAWRRAAEPTEVAA